MPRSRLPGSVNMYLRGIREAADLFLDCYEAIAGQVRNLGFFTRLPPPRMSDRRCDNQDESPASHRYTAPTLSGNQASYCPQWA